MESVEATEPSPRGEDGSVASSDGIVVTGALSNAHKAKAGSKTRSKRPTRRKSPFDDNYSRRGLLNRGWTTRLIERELGEADDEMVNWHYRSGPPIQLFDKQRVHRAERRNRVKSVRNGKSARRQTAQKAAAKRRAILEEWVENLEINVPRMDLQELDRRAVSHFNARALERNGTSASLNSDRDFLDRISVNFLRHELTDYDSLLVEIHGQAGADDARTQLRWRVLEAIGDVYPHLALEAALQSIRRRW